MKRTIRLSLRVLSVVLALMMCATMLPTAVFAAVLDEDPAGENGPSTTYAYVAVSDGFSWKYPYRVKTGEATVLDGAASYDKSTNTLTLNNFHGAAIETNKMGEDFTICLVGSNSATGGLSVWGDAWGGSANITGDGNLTVSGITLNAETAPAVLNIGPDARVTATEGGIHVYNSASDNPIRFAGRERSRGKVGHTRNTTPALHPSWDLSSTSYGEEIYYNPTKPYQNYSQYADTVYFAARRSVHPAATRAKDKKTMKAVSFTLREVRYENGMYVWYSTITDVYIWEDSALYQQYKNDLSDLTLEAYDPNYQHVTEESFNENEWAIVNNLGEPLEKVDIVPQSADIGFFPEIEAADLDDAMMGRFYTAKLRTNAVNGGAITDYKITGSATSWLHIDSKGNLSGKPKNFGNYSFFATAVETADGHRVESLPQRFTVFVAKPDNVVAFTSAVSDTAAHSLLLTKKDNSFTKTIDLGNKVIGEGMAVSLDGVPSGDYTLTFTGTLNGAEITYSNSTLDFTLTEGENNTVSFDPGTSTVVPNKDSVALRVENLFKLKDCKTPFLRIEGDSYSSKYDITNDFMMFPNVIRNVKNPRYGIYVYDDAYQLVNVLDGEIRAEGNALTASVTNSVLTDYTVNGIPSDFDSVRFSVNNDSNTGVQVSPPANSWETIHCKLKTLTESDTLTVSDIYGGENLWTDYNTDDYSKIPVTVSGTEINVSFIKFDKNGTITGKVTDGNGNPVEGAFVTCTQTQNENTRHCFSNTLSAVTRSDGSYSFKGVINGLAAKLTVCADHYMEKEVTVSEVADGCTKDIQLASNGYIRVILDKSVVNANFRWDGNCRYAQNGSEFFLPIASNKNGKVRVTMTSTDTSGETVGDVTVKDGVGTLNLTPVRKGFICWSGFNADGSEFYGDYSSCTVKVFRNTTLINAAHPSEAVQFRVDPGDYRVVLTKTYANSDKKTEVTQNLTVQPDEISYVSVKMPDDEEKESYAVGSVTAPAAAMSDELVKIEGELTSFDETDRPFYGLCLQSDQTGWTQKIEAAVVNGKSAILHNAGINKSENRDIDWSFPLHFTFYVRQEATANNPVMSWRVYAVSTRNHLIGRVSVRYKPNLSLHIATDVGATKTTNQAGHTSYLPKQMPFSGKTMPTTQVSLYDNGVLCARVMSDINGSYKGKLTFASSETTHIIRAQATVDGREIAVQDVCSYHPGGAVLSRLWMNGVELSLGGDKQVYVTRPDLSINFMAAIDNPDLLEDVTYTVNGKDVTGKVFFQVSTINGNRIIKAEPNNNQTRWYTEYLNFGGSYPNGIKVLYRSKTPDHSYVDTYTDADGSERSLQVDLGVKRTGVSAGDDDQYSSSFDIDAWKKAILEGYNGEDPESVGAKDEDEPATVNDLYNAMVWSMNKAEGEGRYKTLTAEQAAAKVSSDKAEIRTYTDSPQWTVNDQNLHLRIVELQQKGYQTTSFVDEGTGHKMYMFNGTFYYAKDATPVPSLQIQKVYSGIVKMEDDPRMFKSGKMIGSTLEVQYICDATAKKWYRSQTATMPAGVRSAIHTSSYQIPSKTEAPFSYKDTNVFPAGASETDSKSNAVGAKIGGDITKQGISFEIDFSRVSANTYTSGAISLGGFAYGKMSKATYFRSTDKMYVLNRQTDELMDLVDIGLDAAINKGKNTMYIGVSKESLSAAGVVYTAGKINDAVNKPKDVDDVYDLVYRQLRDNIRYYGTVKSVANYTEKNDNGGVFGDFSLDKYKADRMLQKTKDMADAVVELQKAIENAQHQDEFTSRVTEQMGYLSLAASLAPGVGTEASLVIDTLSFVLQAANDTRNSKVHDAAEKLMEKYRDYMKEDQKVKQELDEEEERVEKYQKMGFKVKTRSQIAEEELRKKKGVSGGGGTMDTGDESGGGEEPGQPGQPGQPGETDGPTIEGPSGGDMDCEVIGVHDPSGKVYEAVLSNTIEDATVTLCKYKDAANPMSVWDDSEYLGQDNPLKTDADGYYRWDVPEGEWYVTAEKEGYVTGSSQNDKAATVTHDGVNYLPVLPPQLDVNIPLVSTEAPVVESVSAREDGVYITFSKYMDESTVIPANFELRGDDGKLITFKLEKLDSEQAPSNINYNGEAPFYTKTVRLSATLPLNTEFGVKVSEKLTSYAGIPMVSEYSDEVYADEKRTLAAPTFSVEAGEVEKNTTVTIEASDGASVIYTTDGSEPTAENGKKAKSGTKVVIAADMTLKAIAVKFDAVTGPATTADYKVIVHVDTTEYEPEYTLGDVNKDGTVDITDATLIQKYCADLAEFDEAQMLAADVNHDDTVNITDATTIQKYLADLIDSF